MEKEQFIREALSLPTDAIGYHVGQYLSMQYPDKELLEGEDLFFNVEEFAKSRIVLFS